MWSQKEFNRRLDNWITGVNDPNAPFNQVDDIPPMCEECQKTSSGDFCLYPCPELDEYYRELDKQ